MGITVELDNLAGFADAFFVFLDLDFDYIAGA